MTNKLPVVGKRYKAKHNNKIFTAVTYLGADLDVSVRMCCNNDLLSDFTYRPKNDNFDKFFEELPENEAETKPETQSYDSESIKKDQMNKAMQSINDLRVYREGYNKGWNECLEEVKKQMPNHISELSPEVKDAMEELKKALSWGTIEQRANWVDLTARNLLNTLDKQFKVNETSESVAVKEEKVKQKFILDSIYYDKQGLPVSIYKKEEEIDRIKMEKLREYFKEKYKSYETQPDENGSFKHIDGIEEETQDLMKKDIFGSGKKQVESEKKIEEETYQALSIQNRASIWRDVSELPRFEKERGQPDLLIRFDDGNVRFGTFNGFFSDVKGYAFKQRYVKQYCLLEAFVSDYEKLKERVKKLEGK